MAIFKKTTEKKVAEKAPKKEKVAKVPAVKATKKVAEKLGHRVNAIVRPHVTEKAAVLAEKGTYVFEVSRDTNKIEIKKAIATLYGVTPVRVNIINLPRTRVFLRGKEGVKSGVRKALVTLAKGDKIELI
jgi:large subunit ribosomal protein L23